MSRRDEMRNAEQVRKTEIPETSGRDDRIAARERRSTSRRRGGGRRGGRRAGTGDGRRIVRDRLIQILLFPATLVYSELLLRILGGTGLFHHFLYLILFPAG